MLATARGAYARQKVVWKSSELFTDIAV